MKRRLAFILCLALAAAAARAEVVGVIADDTTGTIYPAAVEARIGSGGGGAWIPGAALYTNANWTMPANSNAYAAIGMDTSAGNLTLTLSPQDSFQTIVVRKFSNLNELYVIGATTNTLCYDGQTIILDYWPQLTNFYWRPN